MDVCEKRVLRRKATVLAEVVVFDGNLAGSAQRQGLVRDRTIKEIFFLLQNRERVLRFLACLEEVRPAAFDKLCYLLENQGYTWLCDELWVELICEKGNLIIEPHVLGEARQLVRQRLGEKRRLDEQDIHELTTLIATRYQVAKETFTRQERRIKQKKHSDKEAVRDNVRDLCHQIERCMASSAGRGRSRAGRGRADPHPDPHPDPGGGAAVIFDAETHVPENVTGWITSLKTKITDLTNAYTTARMRTEKLKAEARRRRLVSDEPGGLTTETADTETDDEPAKSSSSNDSGNELDAASMDALADASMRRQRQERRERARGTPGGSGGQGASRSGILLTESRSVLGSRKDVTRAGGRGGGAGGGLGAAGESLRDRSSRGVQFESRSSRSQVGAGAGGGGRKRGGLLRKGGGGEGDTPGRSLSTISRSSRRTVRLDLSDEDVEETAYLEPGDARQEAERDVRREARRMVRLCKTAQTTRRTRTGTEGAARTEDQYWRRRCDAMKRCKSVGYYYFLSDRRRERCTACSGAGEPAPRWDCAWWEREGGRSPGGPAKGAPKGDTLLNLYRGNSWCPDDADSSPDDGGSGGGGGGGAGADFDDELCPGAVAVPGRRRRRCLACAYANKELPEFFDAMVAPTGGHHFVFPKLSHRGRLSKKAQLAATQPQQGAPPLSLPPQQVAPSVGTKTRGVENASVVGGIK